MYAAIEEHSQGSIDKSDASYHSTGTNQFGYSKQSYSRRSSQKQSWLEHARAMSMNKFEAADEAEQ